MLGKAGRRMKYKNGQLNKSNTAWVTTGTTSSAQRGNANLTRWLLDCPTSHVTYEMLVHMHA